MKSGTRSLVFLLTCCVQLGRFHVESFSEIIENFLCFANGDYSNKKQIERGDTNASYVQDRFIPVDSDAFPGQPMVYYEEYINQKVLRIQLKQPIEIGEGSIQILTYNITIPRFYERPQGSLSIEEIAGVQEENLKLLEGCFGRFESLGPQGFVGSWEDCLDSVQGTHPHYGVLFRCQDIRGVIPGTSKVPESATLLPYVMVRGKVRYPRPGATLDCSTLCSDEQKT